MPHGIVSMNNCVDVTKQMVFLEDDTVQQTSTFTNNSVSYISKGGNMSVRTIYTVDIPSEYFTNGGHDPYQIIKVNITVPNDVFMLIGNDGLAVNFGSRSTAYIGAESTTLRYGQYGLKIDASDGIQVFNGVYWYTLDEYIGMIAGHP